MSLPKPYYQDDAVTLYHGDCREIVPELGNIGGVVTDPPYGLGERWTGGTWFRSGVYALDRCEWDVRAPQEVVEMLVSLNVPSVIWGGNYFSLPPSRCWLVWSKTNAVATMADCELAWTTLDRPAKQYVCACGVRDRQHPTEKPLALMRWCVSFLDVTNIVDPFAGSSTTLRAAKDLGRKAIGIEIDERYCEIAAKRMSQEVLPLHDAASAKETA